MTDSACSILHIDLHSELFLLVLSEYSHYGYGSTDLPVQYIYRAKETELIIVLPCVKKIFLYLFKTNFVLKLSCFNHLVVINQVF
jgi:hypothetical protein